MSASVESFSSQQVSVEIEPFSLRTKAKSSLYKKKSNTKDANSKNKTDMSNVVYVGRIPHGFYEDQMKAYFSQFGAIVNLRLSRNKKTGASKHYAFIEFKDSDVAEVVANTMNNYLLFTSVLKCHVLPTSQVHPELWKGSNKRFVVFKKNPTISCSEDQIKKRNSRMAKRHILKQQKLASCDFYTELTQSDCDVPSSSISIEKSKE